MQTMDRNESFQRSHSNSDRRSIWKTRSVVGIDKHGQNFEALRNRVKFKNYKNKNLHNFKNLFACYATFHSF